MRDIDLDLLEERLLEARRDTLRNIQAAESEEAEGQREAAGELSRAPSHMADAASDTQEAEKDFANIRRESEQLTAIDEALRLLREDPDSYLTCEECGSLIDVRRLRLVPWTRRCASCARAGEERG